MKLSNPDPSKQVIVDHYRCPEEFVRLDVQGDLSEHAGYFKFGSESVCYARAAAFTPSYGARGLLYDAVAYARPGRFGIALPFEIGETVAALRFERYMRNGNAPVARSIIQKSIRAAYYTLRPIAPVAVRKHLQRRSLRDWDKREFPRWPVDTSVESALETALRLDMTAQGLKEVPFIWFWPDGAQACAVMTHDVETAAGRDFCLRLMDIDY